MYSLEYGKRFSTTFPFNYKATLWFIPICLVAMFLMQIIIGELIVFLLGIPIIMIFLMLGIMGDQGNEEAFEYGLKITIVGRPFREFVPYSDIVFICTFRLVRDIHWLPIESKGLLLILKKPGSHKLQTYLMSDCRQTPIVWILPQVMIQNPNWLQIYHPEIVFLDAKNIIKLGYDLERNSEALYYLINKYRTY